MWLTKHNIHIIVTNLLTKDNYKAEVIVRDLPARRRTIDKIIDDILNRVDLGHDDVDNFYFVHDLEGFVITAGHYDDSYIKVVKYSDIATATKYNDVLLDSRMSPEAISILGGNPNDIWKVGDVID